MSVERFQIRPRFEMSVNGSISVIQDLITSHQKEYSAMIKSSFLDQYISLRPADEDLHYWSPHLSLALDEMNDNETFIRGHFGPSPNIWTMFFFFYALIVFAGGIISIIGMANWFVGNSYGILWLVPLCILLFSTLYLLSYLGQRRGNRQMRMLKNFLKQAIGEKEIAK